MIRGIIATNALPLGDDLTEGAVYRMISRINHTCAPIAAHSWNSTTRKEHLHTIEDIPARSLILTSYISMLWKRSDRQKTLNQNFRFACQCSANHSDGWGGWSSQRVHLTHRWECVKASEEGIWIPSQSPDSTEQDWRTVQDDVLVRCIPNLCRLHQPRPRQGVGPEHRTKVGQAGSQCE